MALTNYTELQTSAALWLNRSDLGTVIPDFVRLCESDLNARLRCPVNEKRDTAFAVASRFTDLPSDFAEMRRVVLSAGQRIELKPISSVIAGPVSYSSTPTAYAIHGNQIELVPLQACTLELTYWRTVQDLESNATNDVLVRFPDLYLFGTCVQAALYLGDGNLVAKFQPWYEKALGQANGQKQLGSGLAVRVA